MLFSYRILFLIICFFPHLAQVFRTFNNAVTGAGVVCRLVGGSLVPTTVSVFSEGVRSPADRLTFLKSTSPPLNFRIVLHGCLHYCKDNLLDVLQYLQRQDYCEYNPGADPAFRSCSVRWDD